MTRCKTPFHTMKYLLHGYVLESVPSAKYLGVTISEDLKWTDHINDISKKANKTLGFLKRNIRIHNKDLKSTSYKTLVRPQPTAQSMTLLCGLLTQIKILTNLSPYNGGPLDG